MQVGADIYMGKTLIKNKKNIDVIEILGPAYLKKTSVNFLVTVGPTKLNTIMANKIFVTGPLNFQKLQVKKMGEVIGPVKGKQGDFLRLDIVGPVKIEETHIGALFMTGSLFAKKSTIENLDITSEKIVLKDTTIGNIIVRQSSKNKNKLQRIHLRQGSIVKGDVIFESGNGYIDIKNSSKIYGKVKGLTKNRVQKRVVKEVNFSAFWRKLKKLWDSFKEKESCV